MEAAGFKAYRREGMSLAAAQILRLDVGLEVGPAGRERSGGRCPVRADSIEHRARIDLQGECAGGVLTDSSGRIAVVWRHLVANNCTFDVLHGNAFGITVVVAVGVYINYPPPYTEGFLIVPYIADVECMIEMIGPITVVLRDQLKRDSLCKFPCNLI